MGTEVSNHLGIDEIRTQLHEMESDLPFGARFYLIVDGGGSRGSYPGQFDKDYTIGIDLGALGCPYTGSPHKRTRTAWVFHYPKDRDELLRQLASAFTATCFHEITEKISGGAQELCDPHPVEGRELNVVFNDLIEQFGAIVNGYADAHPARQEVT